MTHAPTATTASYAAFGGGRWARVFRAGVAACALAAVASSPALAQRHGDRGDQRMQDQRVQDPRMQQDPRLQDPRLQQDPRAQQDQRPVPAGAREPRFDPRAFDSREVEDRRQDHAMRGQEAHRPSRLTPEERRDLRRQINEAGMDLYAHPPHH